MNKLILLILPTDIWNTIFDYVLENLYLNNVRFSKYKYIANTFSKNISYIRNSFRMAPHKSMCVSDYISRSSNLGMVRYLEICRQDMLKFASYNGNLEMFKYLIEKCGLIYKAISYDYDNNCIFRYACKNGHLGILKYIANKFKLPHDQNAYAIREASVNGHLEVLQYLVDTIGLKQIVINFGMMNSIFMDISIKGHLDIIRYLTETFKLAGQKKYMSINHILGSAFSHGHSDIFKYITETFSVQHRDVSCIYSNRSIHRTFRNDDGKKRQVTEIIMKGRLEILEYLLGTF